jgi:hypothetical protein
MLHCVGYNDLTQEDLVEAFIRDYYQNFQATRHTVLENFRSQPIPNAAFGSFKMITERLLAGNLPVLQLIHRSGLSPGDYLREIKEHIAADQPVLISARSGPALCHITVVHEYDGDVLSTYDPGLGGNVDLNSAKISFESDLLTFDHVSPPSSTSSKP